MAMTAAETKEAIFQKASDLGANLTRSCPVGRWEAFPIQAPAFWPQNIWPWARNVIVLGIPLYAPMVRTTPSMVYQELYETSNRVLDEIAYRLSNYITTALGYRACFFPRDGYSTIEVLPGNPSAAFSHVIAGYYAGMGTIGDSHNLITREFGPRLRVVSVLTDAPVPPDEMLEEDLCIHCKKCLRGCPSGCFQESGSGVYRMDKEACTQYHIQMKNEHHWPCGVCISVCPVGEDLRLYQGTPVISPEGVAHCQSYGS